MSASTATSANDRQVGGTHYKTGGLEHWDLFGPEYLMGCASKYVARHMDKDGREDLEKAIHFCEKVLEELAGGQLTNTIATRDMLEWAYGTRMTGVEINICYHILCTADFRRAIERIRELIGIKYPDTLQLSGVAPRGVAAQTTQDHASMVPQNRPGTPEDGGHHARQPVEEEEEIQRWDNIDFIEDRLPRSLSEHEWQHRCTESVQKCYEYDVSAARYVIRPELVSFTENGRED